MAVSTDFNLRSLPLSEDLLHYYREKLEQCEKHYDDAIKRIAGLKLPHEEAHKTAWEAHKRAREVTELQNALSDAQLAVFEERKEVLRLKAENDELRVQELRDRKKIKYLLSIGNVAEDEISYFRDKLHKRLVKSASSDEVYARRQGGHGTEEGVATYDEGSIRLTAERGIASAGQASGLQTQRSTRSTTSARPPKLPTRQTHQQQQTLSTTTSTAAQPAQAVRSSSTSSSDAETTVNLQNTTIQSMQLRLVALQTQLEEQRAHYESVIDHLLRDRKTRVEEEKVRREYEARRIEEFMEKLNRFRALSRENTRELLHTKKAALAAERNLIEQKTQMTNDLLDMKKQLASEKSRQEQAEQTIETRITRKQESLVHELRREITKNEDEIKKLKTALATTDQSGRQTIEHLKSRLASTASSYQSLKRRRDYEIEGFTNDIVMLRKQLKTLEKNILKYSPLEDKELVLLNLARETGERVAKISTGLHGLKAKVHATEEELRSVAF
ncbi:Coiled-coil domain-containing protein 77 [Rhizophlyctis rosea]|nr:Coiled-coil domain-containing protein 77 [Rhizophlyctis rosea]